MTVYFSAMVQLFLLIKLKQLRDFVYSFKLLLLLITVDRLVSICSIAVFLSTCSTTVTPWSKPFVTAQHYIENSNGCSIYCKSVTTCQLVCYICQTSLTVTSSCYITLVEALCHVTFPIYAIMCMPI
jgi:hypothetical protein